MCTVPPLLGCTDPHERFSESCTFPRFILPGAGRRGTHGTCHLMCTVPPLSGCTDPHESNCDKSRDSRTPFPEVSLDFGALRCAPHPKNEGHFTLLRAVLIAFFVIRCGAVALPISAPQRVFAADGESRFRGTDFLKTRVRSEPPPVLGVYRQTCTFLSAGIVQLRGDGSPLKEGPSPLQARFSANSAPAAARPFLDFRCWI